MSTNQTLEPFSNSDLHIKLQIQCNRLEVAINSLSTNHRNIPEVAVLYDVMNDLDDMESHCSKVEEQKINKNKEVQA